MANASPTLSIENAWNSVALEERLELIARSHAVGIASGLGCLLLFASAAYGFDAPIAFFGFIAVSLALMPIFSSRYWRKHKPSTILQYLAVRSVARRYALGFNIRELDIILIFRGSMREIFESEEARDLILQSHQNDQSPMLDQNQPVWVSLFRGGVVILSEYQGGAKLESVTVLNENTICRPAKPEEGGSKHATIIRGSGDGRSRLLLIDSKYAGALYVFKQRLLRLYQEYLEFKQQVEKLKAEGKYTKSRR